MAFAPMSPTPQLETPEAAESRGRAKEMFARTNALMGDANFQWFLDTCIGEKIKEANAASTSLAKTPQDRDYAAHVHDALLAVRAWVQENHEASISAANS